MFITSEISELEAEVYFPLLSAMHFILKVIFK